MAGMRAVLQRVSRARVVVGGEEVASIGHGLLLFLGVAAGDTDEHVHRLVEKVRGLRVFEDGDGKMNLACEAVGGEFLVVSQFTLLADLSKGKRPGFEGAMKPPESQRLYEAFCRALAEATGRPVLQGRFGASMQVDLTNDGPATFVLDV